MCQVSTITIIISLFILGGSSDGLLHPRDQQAEETACKSVPDSFAKRWQVVGEQGRQIWVSKYYMRVFGPIDDVFGEAAGGRRIAYMALSCYDDMVQVKGNVATNDHKKRSCVCLRLKEEDTKMAGYFVRQEGLDSCSSIDCELWRDSHRHVSTFHLTDHLTWDQVDNRLDQPANAAAPLEACSSFPEKFIGCWGLFDGSGSIQFQDNFYVARGPHGRGPFWQTDARIVPYQLLCSERKVVFQADLWKQSDGEQSQVQCLVLSVNGDLELIGHAVNAFTNPSRRGQDPAPTDCHHRADGSHIRYDIHLTKTSELPVPSLQRLNKSRYPNGVDGYTLLCLDDINQAASKGEASIDSHALDLSKVSEHSYSIKHDQFSEPRVWHHYHWQPTPLRQRPADTVSVAAHQEAAGRDDYNKEPIPFTGDQYGNTRDTDSDERQLQRLVHNQNQILSGIREKLSELLYEPWLPYTRNYHSVPTSENINRRALPQYDYYIDVDD